MTREVKAGGGGCSSLRVLGGGWVTMNSHGVEISIAGGVVEMVRGPTPRRPRPLLIVGPSLNPNPV